MGFDKLSANGVELLQKIYSQSLNWEASCYDHFLGGGLVRMNMSVRTKFLVLCIVLVLTITIGISAT